jgi:hypothetical protein
VVSGPPDLQVIAQAFEECAQTFTTQGGKITALASQLSADCTPLGDRSVGGDQCGTLGQQVTTLVRSLDSVGTSICTGMAHALQQVLAKFQEVDQGQAANPHLVPQPGGGR